MAGIYDAIRDLRFAGSAFHASRNGKRTSLS